jgi:hypothetical protein
MVKVKKVKVFSLRSFTVSSKTKVIWFSKYTALKLFSINYALALTSIYFSHGNKL